MRAALLIACCIGCSSKHAPPKPAACARGDEIAAGLTKHGAHFDVKLVSAEPATPARGDNKWLIEVDASGAPAQADVAVTPFMPDHGHGTPIKVNVAPASAAGQYQLAPLNLWMPGYWEISITASAGNDRDTAVFKLCIPS